MSPRASNTVATEAREWFVRLLDDDVSADELALWQAWLARSPAHRSAWDRVADAWSLGGEGTPTRPSIAELATDTYDGSAAVAQWREKPGRNVRPALIAASLAVAVLGASAAYFALPTPEAQAITTARAEHKAAALADGSKVEVGALTGVQVRMSDLRREVKLDRGEAFFKVSPDPKRAFVVKTPFGAVKGAGAFNVDVAGEQLCITVTEGDVVVQPSGLFARPVKVAAGQQIVVNSSGSVVAAGSPVTWTQGRLEYRNTPLSVVVADVNRYAEHPVVLHDPSLGDLEYTGAVRLDATGDWVKALPAAFPLKVSPGGGGATVLSSRM
ncbi:MAG: FecR family protein [Parcubacteria group bacterium]